MRRSIAFALLALAATAAHADRCVGWEQPGQLVSLESCSYDNGGSGYYKVTNRGTRPATVCWTMEFNNGKKDRGCHSSLGAGKESTGSCFHCGGKNTGTRSMALTKYEVK